MYLIFLTCKNIITGNPSRGYCHYYVILLMFCCIVENKTLSLARSSGGEVL